MMKSHGFRADVMKGCIDVSLCVLYRYYRCLVEVLQMFHWGLRFSLRFYRFFLQLLQVFHPGVADVALSYYRCSIEVLQVFHLNLTGIWLRCCMCFMRCCMCFIQIFHSSFRYYMCVFLTGVSLRYYRCSSFGCSSLWYYRCGSSK